jgi:membrane protease YdiL (CAAX protease family)
MDFNVKKPTHIFALAILVVAFAVIILLPIYSFFNASLSIESTQIEEASELVRLLVEIIALVLQILLVAIGIFIIVPLIWYFLVNKLSFKEILNRIKLRKEGMDMAVLWGVVSMIAMFAILFVIGIILTLYGVNLDESSNITDLEQIFPLPSILVIVAFQPIGEEIFFRGFLLEKINSMAGKETAIVVTSVLFGIAHLTYGNIYPAIMTGILGLILAYMVVKTKNLTTAIVAHIFFNVTSVTLYIIGQSFMP